MSDSPTRPPTWQELGNLDKLFFLARGSKFLDRPLHGAPGHTVRTWLMSAPGQEFVKLHPAFSPELWIDAEPSDSDHRQILEVRAGWEASVRQESSAPNAAAQPAVATEDDEPALVRVELHTVKSGKPS